MKLGSLIGLVALGTLLSASCGDDGEENAAGQSGNAGESSAGSAGNPSSSGMGGERAGAAGQAEVTGAGAPQGEAGAPEPTPSETGGAAGAAETAGAAGGGGESMSAGAPSSAGSAGTEGEAGAGTSDGGAPGVEGTALGNRCTSDADCGDLDCIEADSGAFNSGDLGRAGPANGLCTMACDSNNDCDALEPGALCVGFGTDTNYCVQGCEFGSQTLVLFTEDKCHARPEMACSPLFRNTGDTCDTDNDCFRGELCAGTCIAIVPACLPRCADAADCPEDWFCDPDSGLCVEDEPSKNLLGDSCDPESDAKQCNGMCLSETNEDGDVVAGRCQELCTIGAGPPICGWDGDTGLPAVCSPAFNPDLLGPGAWGDVGLCFQYCNCDSDCRGDSICAAFEDGPHTDGAGVCEYPFLPDGTARQNVPCD